MKTITQQTQETSLLIDNLIENDLPETLKEIKQALSYPLTLGVPIELISIENREMIEKIDNYLNN